MELFYAKPGTIQSDKIILDDFERKHVLQALRKSSGAEVYVTDGIGTLWRTQLVEERPKLVLSIISSEKLAKPKPEIWLAIGYIRPSRLEFVFEKGTELGVSRYFLIRTEHANFASKNVQRYQKILRQAIKQSQQFFLPEIYHFDSLATFIRETAPGNVCISAIDQNYPLLFQKIQTLNWEKTQSFLYIVGPEGGFSQPEVQHLSDAGFAGTSLGANRLRAETAAISGISIINQYIHQ